MKKPILAKVSGQKGRDLQSILNDPFERDWLAPPGTVFQIGATSAALIPVHEL